MILQKLISKVGTILAAEKVEKADKLLKLEVDLGFGKKNHRIRDSIAF